MLAYLMSTMLVASQTGCAARTSSPSIVVFAAASLKPTFTRIGERFEADHPGTSVRFDFASASDLAIRLTQGARGDVFASADTAQMTKVVDAGLIAGTPVDFASNTLAIVTAVGNPKRIESFADLAQPGLTVLVSPPPTPCGVATLRVENSTGVHLDPASEEPNVEDVLNKVITGQADAGLVNITDARAAGDTVTTVMFPEAAEAVTTYPIAVLKPAGQPSLAGKFVDLVTNEYGQKILGRAGFGKP